MSEAWTFIDGDRVSVLTIVDHASKHVPGDIDLGIDPALLDTHIGSDIGAADLARHLGYPAFLAGVSRLVIDVNREIGAEELVSASSDGHVIPGNAGDTSGRVARFWTPYHQALSHLISEMKPKLLISLHSFTPNLASRPHEERPWQIGVLYNEDDRAARIALPLLTAAGIVAGDQLPYSGKLLNATMNRHGEGTATPYLGLEVRQDLIGDTPGIERVAAILRPIIESILNQLPFP